MDTSTLTIIGAFITVMVGAYVAFKKSNTDSRATTITGEIGLADGWQKYAKKLEDRITALEQGVIEREKVYIQAIKEKDQRIDELEQRIDDLETEVDKYRNLSTKVVEAKDNIKETVENSLGEISKQ